MRRSWLAIVAAAVLASPALGQSAAERRAAEIRAIKLEREAVKLIADGDLGAAEDVLREQLEADPASFTARYNLACIFALRGEIDAGSIALASAVDFGFDDVRTLERDPHLAPLRETAAFAQLMDDWPAVLDARRVANREQLEANLEGTYRQLDDDRLRIDVLSAHDGVATEQALTRVRAVGDWAERAVMPGIFEEPEHSRDPWVTLGLLETGDFGRWAVTTFGAAAVRSGFSSVGGIYEHDIKRLIVRDLGATLRHETMHAIHYRSMSRLGQLHPIWIQEGLCSLPETSDGGDDTVRPAPCWRTNSVKRLAKVGRLIKLETLATMDQRRFTRSRPLANYAMARAVFLWLDDRGVLRDWYAAYTAGYDDDPSGLDAMASVLEVERSELDAAFRAWIDALEEVPETGSDLKATLGVDIEAGEGDGPVVVDLPLEARRRTGLRLKDVITHVNGSPVCDMHELIRQLGRYGPGASVRLNYRRGRLHGETTATLIEPED